MARSPDVMNTPAYKRLGRAPSGTIDGGERDVMNYASPKGPTNIMEEQSPGLHGKNFDYCGSQERSSLKSQSSGKARLQGDAPSMCGSQGKY